MSHCILKQHIAVSFSQINSRYKGENSHWASFLYPSLRETTVFSVYPSLWWQPAATVAPWEHVTCTPVSHVHTFLCWPAPSLLCSVLASRVKASSTQHQSKSPPFCCLPTLFKWISLAVGHKSNELLFPLQPQIVLVMKYRFNVHITPLRAFPMASQTTRDPPQRHQRWLFTAFHCESGVSGGLDWFLQPVCVTGNGSDNRSLFSSTYCVINCSNYPI